MSAAGWQYPKLAQCLISDKFTTCQSARSCYNKSINLGRPPWLGWAGRCWRDTDQHFVSRVMLLRCQRGWAVWHCPLGDIVEAASCPPRCPFQEQTLVAPWTSIWADSINVVVFKWNSFQLIATFFGRCSFLFFQFFVPAFRALTKHSQLSLLGATVDWASGGQVATSRYWLNK